MMKWLKTILIVIIVLLAAAVVLLRTLSHWLPVVAQYGLPAGVKLTLSGVTLHADSLGIADLTIKFSDCSLAEIKQLKLGYQAGSTGFTIDTVKIGDHCMAQWPEIEEEAALEILQIQQQFPALNVLIKQLYIDSWPAYSGKLQFIHSGHHQQLAYHSPLLTFNAQLKQKQLSINKFTFNTPDKKSTLNLQGQLDLANHVGTLPPKGHLQGVLSSSFYPQSLLLNVDWLKTKGILSIRDPNSVHALAVLPWSFDNQSLSIKNGKWHWPHEKQPVFGDIALTFSEWNPRSHAVNIQARINMLTDGLAGKGNLVLSFGPGKIGLVDSQAKFQLTGRASWGNVSLDVSVPGTLNGALFNPVLTLHQSALLRAKGAFSSTLYVDEIRFPLAGIKIAPAGITGRLQAITQITHGYWGKFNLHLDGQANQFWPDQGYWQWNYWGRGYLPTLDAHWDVAGRGGWHDTLVTIQQLSTGFDRVRYHSAILQKPRLILSHPLKWQRQPQANALQGTFQMVADRLNFNHQGHFPQPTLDLVVKGINPADFQWKAVLNSAAMGPINLIGRWDGQQLRGRSWWPEQSLTVFQPLIPPALQWQIRGGTLHAQVSFSATPSQGLIADGHWVVKQGAIWLRDGEVQGLDFVMPFRLSGYKWSLGHGRPITLKIASLNNLFQMTNLTVNLQGSYPYDLQNPLVLSQASVGLLSGYIRLPELRLPQQKPAILVLEGLNLSELLTTLKQKQFALSGVINGELPLNFNHPRWLIQGGWVKNRDTLTLRIDQQFADAMIKDNIVAGTAMDLLRYLQISRASSRMNLDQSGNLTLSANITGFNTQKSTTTPIYLNYHHQENVFDLWRSLRFSGSLEEWLEQSMSLIKGEK